MNFKTFTTAMSALSLIIDMLNEVPDTVAMLASAVANFHNASTPAQRLQAIADGLDEAHKALEAEIATMNAATGG